jgi:anti-sigma factor RsiW
MKTCAKTYDYFAYLEGRLDAAERKAYEQHFAECHDCVENLYTIQNFLLKIEESKALQPSPYTFTRIMGRLEQKRLAELRYRKWQPAVIGMFSILAILLGMFIGNLYFKKVSQGYASYLHLNEAQQEVIELSLLDNN